MSNSFYSEKELQKIGFRSLGKNVCISKKASIYSPRKISIALYETIVDCAKPFTVGKYTLK